ncbi:MAG: hypothetical protein IT209_11775 [Armatimonadetes bacterium]|nr:hypothetical protein [Armatimonadota bacterium]
MWRAQAQIELTKYLCIALVLCVLGGSSVSAQLINGDFETGNLQGWFPTGSFYATVSQDNRGMTACHGDFFWGLNVTGWSSDASIFQRVYLTPGSYTVSACVQAETTDFSNYQAGYVNPDDYKSGHSNANIRIDLNGGIDSTVYQFSIDELSDGLFWKRYALNFTVQQAGYVTIFLTAQQSDQYLGHWTGFDDVKLERQIPAVGQPASTLLNGDFEQGITGWTQYGSGSVEPGGFGIVPCSGAHNWQAVANGVDKNGGIFQTLFLDRGIYTVRACTQAASSRKLFFYYAGEDSKPPKTTLSIRVDTTGGNNPNQFNFSTGSYETGFRWRNAELTFAIDNPGPVTLFLDGRGAGASFAGTWIAFDNVTLTRAAHVSKIGELKTMPEGTGVILEGAVVTANTDEAGANYVEMVDRSSGIRAESAVPFLTGSTVTVQGALSTKPTGERFLASAVVVSEELNLPLQPLTTRVSSLGPNTDPDVSDHSFGTVGLLMRVAGTVQSTGDGFLCLSDGSGSVKVDRSSAGSIPEQGTFVTLTGIVELAMSKLDTVETVLRPRSPADVEQSLPGQ